MADVLKTAQARFRGPHTGAVAAVYVVLFMASLVPVSFMGSPRFPVPSSTAAEIAAFFNARPDAALLCAFLQFGAAIPLGIYAVTMRTKLRFLGVRAAGADIALFGGVLTAVNVMATACLMWAMTAPAVATNLPAVDALYRMAFGLGGVGYSVPFGILVAGIAVTAGFMRLLPRWLVVTGLIVAVVGELSWLEIVFPKLLLLIPLTRFPGFLWMIAAGFALKRRGA